MKTKSLITLCTTIVLIALVTTLALTGISFGKYSVLPVADSISLGLDLRGGIYAVYIAKNPEQEGFSDLLEATVGVLRNRLTQQGFTESTVTKQGTDRIRIEIPDVQNPDEILNIIGTPAHLEFLDPTGAVVIEGKDIKVAKPMLAAGNQPVISFELNESGKQAFAESTAKYVGQPIRIMLDGVQISAPNVKSAIPDGQGTIDGMGTINEASRIAGLIMSGALPLDIAQDEVSAISATLGVEALNTSLLAGFIGLALVFLFMLLFYRLPGLAADIALCIYVLIVVFCVALIPGVQLTLPGIAGILLGIGMAVDANVIIFERFREELRDGRTLEQSINKGFHNALSAIIDSNVTTIIAAMVLMYFGTGPIKGFAITLLIGVLCSMFTAIFVTRFLLKQVSRLGFKNQALYTRPFNSEEHTEQKPFTKNFRIYLCASLVVVLLAVAFSLFGGGLNLGIDFTGGSQLTYEMGEDFDVNDVDTALKNAGVEELQVAKIGTGEVKTGLQIRLQQVEDSTALRNQVEAELEAKYPNMAFTNIEFVGATAGHDLIVNAIKAMLIAFACMLIYIAIRFDFFSGAAALLALVHDVLIMLAFMIFFGAIFKINSSFIAAMLTIVGYSINNTIVIFDRIRETQRMGQFSAFSKLDIVEHSVKSTISRTLNTTLTTLFPLVTLFTLGVASIQEFSFPLLVGMLAGTYSSVALSGQIWAKFMDWRAKRAKANASATGTNPKAKKA